MLAQNPAPKKERRWMKKMMVVYLALFFVAIAFGVGFLWGRFGAHPYQGVVNYYTTYLPEVELPKVGESDLMKLVWSNLRQSYVHQEQIDPKKLYYGSVAGFVSGLGDPYTVFFDPETYQSFKETIEGSFQGIGAELGQKDGRLVIIAPLSGSPAEAAGVMAGDWILTIDGKDTTDLKIDDAVKLIRGTKGTVVTLELYREKVDQPITVKITRDDIRMVVVKTTFRDDGLYYIQLASFNEDSGAKIEEAIRAMKGKNVKGIVLDLRNDPGGLLDKAIEIASHWLKEGTPVVVEKFGDGKKMVYSAKGKPELLGVPTVVLINKGSASASEILAGALRDHGAATLVGETSFGKGSVQELRPLPDGSALKITIAEWLTPKETFINGIGVEPDVKVEFTWDDAKNKKDPQLDKAIEVLLKGSETIAKP